MRTHRAKTIITLGPASNTPEVLGELLKLGVDVIRLNMSHGSLEGHANNIGLIRRLNEELGVHTAILLDLQGPKIRIGEIEGGSVLLKDGDLLTITTEKLLGNASRVSCDYAGFAEDIQPEHPVMIDDGNLKLVAREKRGNEVICEVIHGGLLKPHKGINLPDTHVSTPTITEKDKRDIEFAINHKVDFLALSFVRDAECVLQAKNIIGRRLDLPLIPKIETKEALKNIDAIMHLSDGLLIARGDMGVELPPEEVPYYQNLLIKRAAIKKVPVIVATQMLDSMMNNFRPTRAEVSDVANAVFDGADALMLSGETAAGKFPIEAARTLKSIIEKAEAAGLERCLEMEDPEEDELTMVEAIGEAVKRIAEEMKGVKAVAAFTASGYTTRIISKYHTKVPIFGFTNTDRVRRRMNLHWGVEAFVVPPPENTDMMIDTVTAILLERGICRKGDKVVITAGLPIGMQGITNMIKIHKI